MIMSKIKANLTTHAVVTVEVHVTVGSWGQQCTMDQVYKQASESAEGKVRRLLSSAHDVEMLGAKTVRMWTNCESK